MCVSFLEAVGFIAASAVPIAIFSLVVITPTKLEAPCRFQYPFVCVCVGVEVFVFVHMRVCVIYVRECV